MTTGNPSRLDRVESILADLAIRQTTFQQQLEETRQITDSNARAIAANSGAIAELRTFSTEIREDTANITQMVLDLGTTLSEQIEQDRQERLALQTDVRALIQALRERFASNGHGESHGS